LLLLSNMGLLLLLIVLLLLLRVELLDGWLSLLGRSRNPLLLLLAHPSLLMDLLLLLLLEVMRVILWRHLVWEHLVEKWRDGQGWMSTAERGGRRSSGEIQLKGDRARPFKVNLNDRTREGLHLCCRVREFVRS